jgi:heme/copper-type cytochrome/quinol oxidase subunit 2
MRLARSAAELIAFVLVMWLVIFATIFVTLTYFAWALLAKLKEKEIANIDAQNRGNGLHRAGYYSDCD